MDGGPVDVIDVLDPFGFKKPEELLEVDRGVHDGSPRQASVVDHVVLEFLDPARRRRAEFHLPHSQGEYQ